jgi:hypothetical protein
MARFLQAAGVQTTELTLPRVHNVFPALGARVIAANIVAVIFYKSSRFLFPILAALACTYVEAFVETTRHLALLWQIDLLRLFTNSSSAVWASEAPIMELRPR